MSCLWLDITIYYQAKLKMRFWKSTSGSPAMHLANIAENEELQSEANKFTV